ncbi:MULTISPECIES: SAM-dependent methyltransferase [unclassified Rhizobium]|uniref:SAM-dependent methyltransferase n=1 Tax=unclassified Rhizobium TaxID=2613769 RepID=UPI003804D238
MPAYSSVKLPKPGPNALALITTAVSEGVVKAIEPRHVTAANNAVGNGYLTRDKKDGKTYYPTDRARDMLAMLKGIAEPGDLPTSADIPNNLPDILPSADASGLVATVERARALLDEGDIVNARIVASVAYATAKSAAQFAEQVGATEKLIAKARRMQADALLIETRAKILIADKWDEAQASGQASKGGRPKTVSDGNGFTSEETGLSRKEIHSARKLAAAEHREPGIVERAIQARLSAGLEPTRANLRASVGTSTATKEERGNNLYETPAEAMHTLLALEHFSATVLEPSCGRGAISRMLESAGYGVVLADLVDYGTADQHGELQAVQDFLTSQPPESGSYDIVTNPPYGEVVNAFVAHALRVFRPRKMALLLNLNFLCGFEDDDRNFVMDDCPPSRVHVFKRRLPMMHRDGWDGKKASSRMNTAWFVWEQEVDGSYGDSTVIRRVDWKDHMPAESAVVVEGKAA